MTVEEFLNAITSENLERNWRDEFELNDVVFRFDVEHECAIISGEIEAEWAQRMWDETNGNVVASIDGIELPYHGIPNRFFTHYHIDVLHYNVDEYIGEKISNRTWRMIDSHIAHIIELYHGGKGLYVPKLFILDVDVLKHVMSDVRKNKLKVDKPVWLRWLNKLKARFIKEEFKTVDPTRIRKG